MKDFLKSPARDTVDVYANQMNTQPVVESPLDADGKDRTTDTEHLSIADNLFIICVIGLVWFAAITVVIVHSR
jgi:hypothetical protein